MSSDLDYAYAPVDGTIELAGHGSNDDRLTSISLRRGELTVETHDQPHRATLSAVHQLVWHELLKPQSFPLELRIERSLLEVETDGSPRVLTLYALRGAGAAVGDDVEIVAPLDELAGLALRTVAGDELRALLASRAR